MVIQTISKSLLISRRLKMLSREQLLPCPLAMFPSLLWNLMKVPFNERMSSRLGLLFTFFTSSSKAPNGHWGACTIDKFYLPSMKGPEKGCVCVNLCLPACISMYFHLLSCILLIDKSYERLTISRSTYINCSSWNRDSMLNLYEVKKHK